MITRTYYHLLEQFALALAPRLCEWCRYLDTTWPFRKDISFGPFVHEDAAFVRHDCKAAQLWSLLAKYEKEIMP